MKYDASHVHRVVVKVGSHSLLHDATGRVDYTRLEKLVRQLCDLRNRGLDVCLVSSGAIAVGREAIGLHSRPDALPQKQALAAVGQSRLMSIYQRLFSEYSQMTGQVLMTKNTMIDHVSRKNAQNTFDALFSMGVIPIVNENDTISTYEIQFGDNDTLSAIVTALVGADLVVLLSDIDGLYDADPKTDSHARLIDRVDLIDDRIRSMASGTPGSTVGTGGMRSKIRAAEIASSCGADMIITNGSDFSVLCRIFDDEFSGTLFAAHSNEYFDIIGALENL